MKDRIQLGLVTVFIVAAGIPTFAVLTPNQPLAAQSGSEPSEQVNRHRRAGFWASFGWGRGSAKRGLDHCGQFCSAEGGVASYVCMGGTVSQKLLLGGEINGVTTTQNNGLESTVSGIGAFVAYFYPVENQGFFLKGGLGMAVYGRSTSSEGESGLGFTGGVGYDVRLARNFSLTPFGTLTRGSFEGFSTTVWQVGLGFSFH